MKFQKTLVILTGVLLGAAILASSLLAGPKRAPTPKAQDVKLVGQLVDLQTFMTEKCNGDDFLKCTRENIRTGVPAAVITDDEGVVIIGMGDKNPARLLIPLAYQNVEIQGKLYDKDGLLYIDMTAVKVFKEEGEEESHGDGAVEGSQEP